MAPPAHFFLDPAQPRPRRGRLRVAVSPRSDHRLGRNAQTLEQTRDRRVVGIRPAADEVSGAADGGGIEPPRALAPVLVLALMAKPLGRDRRGGLQAAHPGLFPAWAEHLRVRRTG